MPVYDRRCSSCTQIQRDLPENINADQAIECPVCHEISLVRVILPGASYTFHVSGSSYANGYS